MRMAVKKVFLHTHKYWRSLDVGGEGPEEEYNKHTRRETSQHVLLNATPATL
jgi:hypothetical protein